MEFDFSGWATKANLKCSDGVVIMKDAFKNNDGQVVPLVWNHQHNDPSNVLGHALLENRKEGVYAYCTFNETESGKAAKTLVSHGDVCALSIFANQLKKNNSNVTHGNIREVSLVLAGANPGAFIDSVISHGEESDDEAIIFSGEEINLSHADEEKDSGSEEKGSGSEKTVKEVFEAMSEEQKTVVYMMVGQALKDAGVDISKNNNEEDDEEDSEMKHNVFDTNERDSANVLSHSDLENILNDAKRHGSLKDSFASMADNKVISHAVTDDDGNTVNYGIANIDYLFPDARNVSNTPDFIKRDTDWVAKVMRGAKHLPFSRVKSIHANITMDEARAKGFVKGGQKTEEVFALLKRNTNPTTIYKKQKLDRDDVIDITDFDVVAWIKSEMRLMLDEEIARAALIGDGRVAGTDDKISEDNIRPIWTDNSLYTVRKAITLSENATDQDRAKAFIRAAVKARKDYKGSGNPALFTTEDVLTDCLLIEDGNGRVIYDTVEKLRTALRVSEIITCEVMEGQTREGTSADAGYNFDLMGIFVNMSDYAFGADKGGAVSMFDDFDIDFNTQKYLIETRCSGALIKPYSAIVIELKYEPEDEG